MKINSCLLPLVIALNVIAPDVTAQSSHKVYRCERDGHTVFSQIPCEQNAEQVEVESSQSDILTTDEYQQQAKQKLKSQTDKVNQTMLRRSLQRQIAQGYQNVERLKRQLATEFKALSDTRFRTQQQADKAKAELSNKYDRLIELQHERIKALHEQLKAM